MPGAFKSIFVLAFDLDDRGQALPAFDVREAQDETAAIDQAHALGDRHAGVVVWKRESSPAVGEEGEPVIIFQTGTIGDFN
jgi:hypothetical protein